MIKVMTMDKRIIAINIDHIERIESVPDTIITLNNGKKIIVLDKMDEIIEKIAEFQRSILKCRFMQETNF